MRAPLQAWYRTQRARWLAQRDGSKGGGGEGAADFTLTGRRVFILPTRPGLAFVLLLLAMLVGALNYNLGLGFALTFFAGACAVADMVLTTRNLVGLTLAPGRTQAVFAGDEASFELLLLNRTQRARYAIELGFEPGFDHLAQAGQPPATSVSRAGAATPRATAPPLPPLPPMSPAPSAPPRAHRPLHAADVAAGASTAVTLTLPTVRRGWLAAPRIRLATRFPLGLFRSWAYWKPPARTLAVLVYPQPEAPPQPLPSHGAASEDGHGAVGLDNFAGIRSYQPGDPLRQLAWRQIARLDPAFGGQLATKQFDGGAVAELAFDFAELPAQLGLETRLSRLTAWVLQAEQRALPYRLRLGAVALGPALGEAHRAACLRALALYDGSAPGAGSSGAAP